MEIVLPTYITKPGEDEKFYPSEVKAIAEKVGGMKASRIGRIDGYTYLVNCVWGFRGMVDSIWSQ